jgi:16S rRNA (cytosine1402-N4)-methyltransferase
MASHYIQSIDQKKLFTVLKDYGELPRVPALLRAILARRSSTRIRTSFDLVEVAKDVYRHDAKKFLPQIFQAVRIAVNDEIASLQHLLAVAPTLLNAGGRLVVISYHSLEDRPVKEAFRHLTRDTTNPLTGALVSSSPYAMLTKKPVKPSDDEVQRNPRARSAILRAIIKKKEYTSHRTA